MKTVDIHVKGLVQGVGFRPYTFNLAKQYRLTGQIKNRVDGVHMVLTGEVKDITDFCSALELSPPPKSIIEEYSVNEVDEQHFEDLKIVTSQLSGQRDVTITPDIGICLTCSKEIETSGDRRFSYGFTSCDQCGPRFSILKKLPFDRYATTMEEFVLCPNCQKEHDTPEDRRFYAQTISCPQCAVALSWWKNGQLISDEQDKIIPLVIEALKDDQIVGIKGISGYLLLADASSKKAIVEIRQRKNRPSKPFALLYKNIDQLNKDVITHERSLNEWNSDAAPIVLFQRKNRIKSGILHQLIAPGSDLLGIMRPSVPILQLIADRFEKPLIATSANASQCPIEFNDNDLIAGKNKIADFVLSNKRIIKMPQDDSVVGFTPVYGQKIIYRRSRGYAPSLEKSVSRDYGMNSLSMGALLKSTFSIQRRTNIYISQYLGNTLYYDCQKRYQYVLDHLLEMINFQPEEILVDAHPEYFATQLGEQIAKDANLSVTRVQHHKAHFASVLWEHDLLESDIKTLGIVWDGTGYGDDANIWGGEFFCYESNRISRLNHFNYFDQLLGDKMVKEPRLCALSLAKNNPEAQHFLRPKFSHKEWALYQKYLFMKDTLKTSSVGRLFDGVAFLLGIETVPSYEGESAVKLQHLANSYDSEMWDKIESYPIEEPDSYAFFDYILKDIISEKSIPEIAFKFHLTLVTIIRRIAEKHNFKQVAFSGGVFQNSLLVDLIIKAMDDDFDLYFHKLLSPNDENISMGQLAFANMSRNTLAQENKFKHAL